MNTNKLYSRDTRRKYENWKETSRKDTAVNNLVGGWRKKLVVEHRRNREAFPCTSSIFEVSKHYVVNVLKVCEENANFRNPLFLFNKSVTLGSSMLSDETKIYTIFSRFGSNEEQMEVLEAFERLKYRIRDMGMLIHLSCHQEAPNQQGLFQILHKFVFHSCPHHHLDPDYENP